MEYRKGKLELNPYSTVIDDLGIMPETLVVTDDRFCEITFIVADMSNGFPKGKRTVTLSGELSGNLFETSIEGRRFTFDVLTNVITPLHDYKDEDGEEDEVEVINKSISLVGDKYYKVTKSFAENNLSKEALKYASHASDKFYFYDASTVAYILFFELPAIFEVQYIDNVNDLKQFCFYYVKELKLVDENSFYPVFLNHLEKTIIED